MMHEFAQFHGSKTGKKGIWMDDFAARMDTCRAPIWFLV